MNAVLAFACFVLCIVFVVLAIVALIKNTGKAKRNTIIAISTFVLFMVFAINAGNASRDVATEESSEDTEEVDEIEEEVEEAEEETTPEPTVEATPEPVAETEEPEVVEEPVEETTSIPGSLGYTPEEFKVRFNNFAAEINNTLHIDSLEITEGGVQGTFSAMITENIGVLGTINEADGTVRDVMIMGQGDGTAQSGADLMLAIGMLIAATNPELLPDERGDVLKEVGLMDGGDLNDIDKSTVVNGVEYHLMGSDAVGIMFTAGDPNDN